MFILTGQKLSQKLCDSCSSAAFGLELLICEEALVKVQLERFFSHILPLCLCEWTFPLLFLPPLIFSTASTFPHCQSPLHPQILTISEQSFCPCPLNQSTLGCSPLNIILIILVVLSFRPPRHHHFLKLKLSKYCCTLTLISSSYWNIFWWKIWAEREKERQWGVVLLVLHFSPHGWSWVCFRWKQSAATVQQHWCDWSVLDSTINLGHSLQQGITSLRVLDTHGFWSTGHRQ